MFKPRHTFRSVADELIKGLESGTIILSNDDAKTQSEIPTRLKRRQVTRWKLQQRELWTAAVAVIIVAILILRLIFIDRGLDKGSQPGPINPAHRDESYP